MPEKTYTEEEVNRLRDRGLRQTQQIKELEGVIEVMKKYNDLLLTRYLDLIQTVNLNGWGY